MDIEESINNINDLLSKRMSVFYVDADIYKIESGVKSVIKRYVRDLESHHNDLFQYSRRKKMRVEIYHYTYIMCVIGAKFRKLGTIGTSHGYLKNYKIFNLLDRKLNILGRVRTKSPLRNKDGKSNFIGKCAEVKAAYQLNSKSKISHIKDIEFTKAYRPRTLQVIERCPTCNFIFGNV